LGQVLGAVIAYVRRPTLAAWGGPVKPGKPAVSLTRRPNETAECPAAPSPFHAPAEGSRHAGPEGVG
jgi:hypothetical protein